MRYSIQYDLGSDIMFNISLRSCRQIEPIIYIYLPYCSHKRVGYTLLQGKRDGSGVRIFCCWESTSIEGDARDAITAMNQQHEG